MNQNEGCSIVLNDNDNSDSCDSIASLLEWLYQFSPTLVRSPAFPNNIENNLAALGNLNVPPYSPTSPSSCASDQACNDAEGNSVDKAPEGVNDCKLPSPCSPPSPNSSMSISMSSPFDSLNGLENGDLVSQNMTKSSMSISPTDSLVTPPRSNCCIEVSPTYRTDNICETNTPPKSNGSRSPLHLDLADQEGLHNCVLPRTPTDMSEESGNVIVEEIELDELDEAPFITLKKECNDRKPKENSRNLSRSLTDVSPNDRDDIRYSFRSPLSKKRTHSSFIPWRSNPRSSPPQSPTAYNPPSETVVVSEEESRESIAKAVDRLGSMTPDIDDNHCKEPQVQTAVQKYSPPQSSYSPSAAVSGMSSTPPEEIYAPKSPIYEPAISLPCRSDNNNNNCLSTSKKYTPSQLPYHRPSPSKKEKRTSRKRQFHNLPVRCCCCSANQIDYYHPSDTYDRPVVSGENNSSQCCISPRVRKSFMSSSTQTLIHVAPDDTLSPHSILRPVDTRKDNTISSPYDPERFVPQKHYQIQF